MIAGDNLYCSPALFKSLCLGVKKPRHDRSKSDVFALGMTILEAGLLKSVQGVYDPDNGKFNREELEELIDEFCGYYQGGELGFTVRGMLLYDEMQRPDFVTLKQKVASGMRIQPAQGMNQIDTYEQQQQQQMSYGGRRGYQQDDYGRGGGYGTDNFMAYDSNQGGYRGYDNTQPPRGGGGGNILSRGLGF